MARSRGFARSGAVGFGNLLEHLDGGGFDVDVRGHDHRVSARLRGQIGDRGVDVVSR